MESNQYFVYQHKPQAVKIYNKFVLKKKKEHINTPTGLGYRTAYDAVIKEIGILKLLNNPNVIKLHEIIDDPDCEKLYLVMEWAELGQILTWNVDALKFSPYLKDTKYLSEKQICGVIKDTVQGIKYCNYANKHLVHDIGVVHRDIKPQNILMTKGGVAKLIDFSSAEKIGESDMLKGTAGTYQFFSPEACDSTFFHVYKEISREYRRNTGESNRYMGIRNILICDVIQ